MLIVYKQLKKRKIKSSKFLLIFALGIFLDLIIIHDVNRQ